MVLGSGKAMRAASWRMDFERGSREACRWADAVVQTRDEDGEEEQWGESRRHSDSTLEIRATVLWAEGKKLHV